MKQGPQTESTISSGAGRSEAHHQVKNTLQNISSVISVMARPSGGLDADQVKQVCAYVRSLACIHDILHQEILQHADAKLVLADQLLTRILDTSSYAQEGKATLGEMMPCRVSARRAASLSFVLTELLSKARVHGVASVQLELRVRGDMGVISLHQLMDASRINDRLPGVEAEDKTRGGAEDSGLMTALCGADLSGPPIYRAVSDELVVAEISFVTSSVPPKEL